MRSSPPSRYVGYRSESFEATRSAADALQLGAAIVAAEHDPRTLEFVTLDAQLAQATWRQGFAVLSPPETTKPSVTRNA